MKPFLKQMARMVVPSAARAWWADRRLTALSRDEDFQKAGRDFVRWMIEVADLQPHHRVLEPGCGLGRNALPLIEYLRDGGSYDGFDILPGEIEWATRHIAAAHPNFRFQHAHVYNKYYNILDGCPSTEYRFPYEAESFDFVFLGSVFTHMLRADVEHYLDEIARVLKPGGRCFITYYLLNDERRSNGTAARFPHAADGCFLHDQERPEWEVAYDEAEMRASYPPRGLTIERVLLHPDPHADHPQDAVLSVKSVTGE